MKIFTIILILIIIFAIFSIGWSSNELYKDYNNKLEIKGLWFGNWHNETEIKDKAYQMDNSGEWICVNINKDLSYESIISTCTHEASHELFSRKCQDKPEVCFKLYKELNNETN